MEVIKKGSTSKKITDASALPTANPHLLTSQCSATQPCSEKKRNTTHISSKKVQYKPTYSGQKSQNTKKCSTALLALH